MEQSPLFSFLFPALLFPFECFNTDVSEFCRVCVEFVEQGAKQNQLVRAAAALGADKEAVIGGVSALSELLLSAARVSAIM